MRTATPDCFNLRHEFPRSVYPPGPGRPSCACTTLAMRHTGLKHGRHADQQPKPVLTLKVSLSGDSAAEQPNALDLDLYDIPGAQPHGRSALRADALRRAGGDHISGRKRKESRYVGDDLSD
jgi:hypothetical protein